METVKTFDNGAKILDIDGTARIGVAHDGRIYWATPEGWDWVLANARRDGCRVLGDGTGWPTVCDAEYYL